MDQLTNYKHKIDFLLRSNDTSLIQPTQTIAKSKYKKKKCNECKKRKPLDESHQTCRNCYETKKIFISSGNKIIDDLSDIRKLIISKMKEKCCLFLMNNSKM